VYAKIATKMTMSATIAAHTPRTIGPTDGIRGGRKRVAPGMPDGDDEMTAVGFQRSPVGTGFANGAGALTRFDAWHEHGLELVPRTNRGAGRG
jgi:hypothetical protein